MAPKKTPINFETALAELQSIVNALEKSDMPLEDALKAFENGVKLTRSCQQQLNDAKQRVDQLIEQDGELALTPFERDHD